MPDTPHRPFEPRVEIDDDALRHNAREVARLARGRSIIAVVKNNAYGLGLERVARALGDVPEVTGFAVAHAADALALRAAGVRKPVLFMGRADVDTAIALARAGVASTPFDARAVHELSAVARAADNAVRVHLYIDTGMHRLGTPWHQAVDIALQIARTDGVRIEGTFTELCELDTVDDVQIDRLEVVAHGLRENGIATGALHAASTHALFFRPRALLGSVRVGLALYGAYPAGVADPPIELRAAFRLRAPVIRVAHVEAGEGVGYDHAYVAQQPTWLATLPVGHGDGYPRTAVRGAEVLIDGRLYRVIGAVSAGHTIIEVGNEPSVRVGDVATLIGPDDPAILPNNIAHLAGISVYDVHMHLSPDLPRY